MCLRQRNHQVEAFSSYCPDHAFADRVCFRTRHWRSQHIDTQRPDRLIEMLGKDLVSVMDKVLMRAFLTDDCPQLLQRPVRARVRRHVYMRQSACPVLDDNKHVQHPERRSDRDEEVTCENRLCMVPKEGGPALIAARPAWRSLRHVFADRSRRDPDPKLDQ